jgi:hypothetical protein
MSELNPTRPTRCFEWNALHPIPHSSSTQTPVSSPSLLIYIVCAASLLTSTRASPDRPSERLPGTFVPFDIDVWNATVKPWTNCRSDAREPLSNQTSPAAFPGRATSSDLQLQPFNLSPRLHPNNRLAESKSHNRKTSIVDGIQHSRNGSFASSITTPLSPGIIAAVVAERPDASNTGDPTFASAMSISSMTSGTSFSSSSTLLPERGPTPTENNSTTSSQKRVERMHSGRSRRDHGHHPSHSRHHQKEELKTVGEYALHVLFTSVSSFNLHPPQIVLITLL